ncbi:hypothetical protein ACLOJK_005511 [Asimina triloba]
MRKGYGRDRASDVHWRRTILQRVEAILCIPLSLVQRAPINNPLLRFLFCLCSSALCCQLFLASFERETFSISGISTAMSATKEEDPRIHGIASSIRVIPNFPKPGWLAGVVFRPLPSLARFTFSNFILERLARDQSLLSTPQLSLLLPFSNADVVSMKTEASIEALDAYEVDRFSLRGPLRLNNAAGQGIMFQDITTLLLDPKAFKNTIDLFAERYKGKNISVVAGIEARGFIFGPPIALAIGAKFVPLRKPRKLPGEVISEEYVLEYGTDCLEMHIGAVRHGDRALVVDDLIATGGTLRAAMKLLERVGAEVVECACVIGLPEVKYEEAVHSWLEVMIHYNWLSM